MVMKIVVFKVKAKMITNFNIVPDRKTFVVEANYGKPFKMVSMKIL
jgi:hypothetical protein